MQPLKDEFKQLIYDLMNGAIDVERYPGWESDYVHNEFAEGTVCGEEYEKISEACKRICGRLGVEEDKDVEIIVSSFTNIAEHLSMTMYDYGFMFSQPPFKKI